MGLIVNPQHFPVLRWRFTTDLAAFLKGSIMISREVAVELVGDGWLELVNRFYDFVDVLSDHKEHPYPQITVREISVDRGMLKIVADSMAPIVQEMLDKLAWAIERDSAKVCEVCGEKGFRRKALEGSPNRCQPHYIQLVNELADAGKI